jgi:hypothetical protein
MAPPCPLFPSLSGVRLSQKSSSHGMKLRRELPGPRGHLGHSTDRSRVTGKPEVIPLGRVTGYSEKWFPRIAVPLASVREGDYSAMWLAFHCR